MRILTQIARLAHGNDLPNVVVYHNIRKENAQVINENGILLECFTGILFD